MILIRTCGAFYKFRISLYSIFFLFNEMSELELILFSFSLRQFAYDLVRTTSAIVFIHV